MADSWLGSYLLPSLKHIRLHPYLLKQIMNQIVTNSQRQAILEPLNFSYCSLSMQKKALLILKGNLALLPSDPPKMEAYAPCSRGELNFIRGHT